MRAVGLWLILRISISQILVPRLGRHLSSLDSDHSRTAASVVSTGVYLSIYLHSSVLLSLPPRRGWTYVRSHQYLYVALITLFPPLVQCKVRRGRKMAKDMQALAYTCTCRRFALTEGQDSRVALYVNLLPLFSTSTRNQPSGRSSVPSAPSLYRDHSFEPFYQPLSLRVV